MESVKFPTYDRKVTSTEMVHSSYHYHERSKPIFVLAHEKSHTWSCCSVLNRRLVLCNCFLFKHLFLFQNQIPSHPPLKVCKVSPMSNEIKYPGLNYLAITLNSLAVVTMVQQALRKPRQLTLATNQQPHTCLLTVPLNGRRELAGLKGAAKTGLWRIRRIT